MNCFVSGGARGADTIFEKYAEKMGHQIKIFRPEDIDEDDRELYSVVLKKANKTLKRKYPTKNKYVNNLLLRSAKAIFKVAIPDSIHALVKMKDENVSGGTAWAIQAYIDIMVYWKQTENLPIYLYDLGTNVWKQHKKSSIDEAGIVTTTWKLMKNPPPLPTDVWMGIGTRDISENFDLERIY